VALRPSGSSSELPTIGVVGVGSLGYHHARILASLDGVRMAGVYDVDTDRAVQVGADLEVESHSTLEALIDLADGLVVAVPTVHHEAVAVAALASGVDVLVEKPMAPSLEAADRMLQAAESSGALIQVGHVERFNAAIRAAEPFLQAPLFIESHRLAPFVPRSIDVAVVLDLMIHDVDLVQSLVGRPVASVAATGIPVLTPSVDIANARLEFEGGVVANLTASRVSTERMRKLRIFQESGYLSLDLADGSGEFLKLKQGLPLFSGGAGFEVPPEGGLSEIVERVQLRGDGAEPLAKELENFRDAVAGKGMPAVSGLEGREALAVSLLIEERIESNVVDTRTA
jgi:predicted dehydrogenase